MVKCPWHMKWQRIHWDMPISSWLLNYSSEEGQKTPEFLPGAAFGQTHWWGRFWAGFCLTSSYALLTTAISPALAFPDDAKEARKGSPRMKKKVKTCYLSLVYNWLMIWSRSQASHKFAGGSKCSRLDWGIPVSIAILLWMAVCKKVWAMDLTLCETQLLPIKWIKTP